MGAYQNEIYLNLCCVLKKNRKDKLHYNNRNFSTNICIFDYDMIFVFLNINIDKNMRYWID